MSEMVPKAVRDRFRQVLWSKADSLNWRKLSVLDRTSIYENWAKDKEIGGVLAHYMDPRRVRVYIKDTLMKPYQRARQRDDCGDVLLALGLDSNAIEVVETFTQPHGRLLTDGRVICWGSGRDWKSVVFSVFERSYGRPNSIPYAAVFVDIGPPIDEELYKVAVEAGRRLGICCVTRVLR